MTLEDLVTLAQAKIASLEKQRETAVRIGDTELLERTDTELSQTYETAAKLRSLGPT